jgi:DnaJ homolog subfamily A member 2
LGDPDKRHLYDQYGESALQEDGGSDDMFGGFTPEELFQMFHGEDVPEVDPHKVEDTVYPLLVSLEQIFRGETRHIAHIRQIVCQDCKGSGGRIMPCQMCQGLGTWQGQGQGQGTGEGEGETCPRCHGEKEVPSTSLRCVTCRGLRTVTVEEVLTVDIPPGVRHFEHLVYPTAGDAFPDKKNGDIICIVVQVPHPIYKRSDMNLHVEKNISLRECLLGVNWTMRHVNGQMIDIRSKPGDILSPLSACVIPGLGMPSRTTDPMGRKGSLIFHFTLILSPPSLLTLEQQQGIASVLPVTPSGYDPCEVTHTTAVFVDPDQLPRP